MVTADGPISRGAAQRLARTELSKSIYHPHESVAQWIQNQLSKLFDSASSTVPGGWWAVVALVVIAVLVIAGIFARIGPLARTRSAPGSRLLGAASSLSAREHRDLAERYAAAGDNPGAILEFVRAIATELEEQAVLTPGPGRTAAEFAAEAARLLPDQAAELTAAAIVFDEVYYGDRPGSREHVDRLRALDGRIRTAAAGQLARAGAAS
jgi:uncharacterized protein DUF4129